MVLTPEQQAELDALQAEKAKPEPRTETGVAGILHRLIDVVSGEVPRLADPADLHSQAEALAAPAAPAAGGGDEASGFAG